MKLNILLPLFILSITLSAVGQSKKPVKKPTPMPTGIVTEPITIPTRPRLLGVPKPIEKADLPLCFSVDEINIKAEKLGINFHGQDLASIFSEINRRESLKKDEFETTKQFQQRVELESKKPLVGNISSNGLLSFEGNADFNYDADTETMTTNYDFSKPLGWNTSCDMKGNYIPYGGYSLVFFDYSKYRIWLTKFNMPIEKAKKAKPNLKLLLIGTINTEDPIADYKARTRNQLKINLQEIWIYDTATGEIFSREQINLQTFKDISQFPLDDILKLNINETAKLLVQATIHYEKGSDDEAMSALRKIISDEPMSAQAYLLIGKIHFRREDKEQAISSLKTALFWDNKLIDAHILSAKIYLQRSDCSQAKLYISSAGDIDNTNQELQSLKIDYAKRCK